jgi:hypothetical protein
MTKSFNVVIYVCKYFVRMEELVTEATMDDLVQCTNTLCELVQGPCLDNQQLLIDEHVLDVAMRILAWHSTDLAERGITRRVNESGQALDFRKISDLNRAILALMSAMLEG